MKMNWKLIIIFATYLLIFISGFIITIALGITKSNFDGHCVLYLNLRWDGFDEFTVTHWGSETTCEFVIYLPLIVCILFPFIMLLFMGYVNFQSFRGNAEAEKIIRPIPLLAVNTISFSLLFVAACIVSTGRGHMCSSFNDHRIDKGQHFASCYDAERFRWKNASRFRVSSFVRDIVLGEVTMWLCLVWWLILIVPEVLNVWKMWLTRRNRQIPVKT